MFNRESLIDLLAMIVHIVSLTPINELSWDNNFTIFNFKF
jgi:hypothetical protein